MAMWDPWREFSRMEREMRRWFDELWGIKERVEGKLPSPERAGLPMGRRELVGTPPVDLIDRGDSLVLRSEMPGVKKENLKVSVTEDEVSISGKVERTREAEKENYYYAERSYSAWQRRVPLPVKVHSDKAKAKYEDGVLEIILPKVEETKKGKELEIE